jgi:transcriptional regulator with XRE-family HTH domain
MVRERNSGMKHRKKAKVKKAKSVPDWARDIRELSGVLRCSTQEEFAARVGSKQGTVSTWLRGDEARRPSADTFIGMAGLAAQLNPKLASRFLRHAHISDETIFSIAEKLQGDQIIKVAPLIETGAAVLIPRFRETEHGREEAGPPVPLPVEFVPNPPATICLLVDEDSSGVASAPKGLFILDTSIGGTRNVIEYQERVVAAYIPAPTEGRYPNPNGIYVGRLKLFQRMNSRQPDRVWLNVYLVPLVVRPTAERLGIPSYLEPLNESFDETIEIGFHEEREAVSGLEWGDPNQVQARLAEIWSRVGPEFPLDEGVRIIGKVIGRLTGHLEASTDQRDRELRE